MQIKKAVPGERRAAHLATQLAALTAATTLLVVFILIDAGASPVLSQGTTGVQLSTGVSAKYKSSLSEEINSGSAGRDDVARRERASEIQEVNSRRS